MNCKLVCTSWYKLLSESTFTHNYSTSTPFTHFIPIPNNASSEFNYLLEISENGHDCIQTPMYPNLPGWLDKESNRRAKVIGSSNGLVCIHLRKPPNSDIVYICNPIMGEYILLPDHHESHSGGCYDNTYYRFGYIPSTSTIKVLRVALTFCTWLEKYDIFTVGVDDTWRRLDIPSQDIYCRGGARGISLNGFLHFLHVLGHDDDDKFNFVIRTFDFAEEKAGPTLLQLPLGVKEIGNVALGLFNDQLGFVDYSSHSQLTIWRLKEYGNVESWTKDVILKKWLPPVLPYNNRSLRLVGGLKSSRDSLIAHSYTNVVSFNAEQKKFTKVDGYDVGIGLGFMMAYAPSFMSLNELRMTGKWRGTSR